MTVWAGFPLQGHSAFTLPTCRQHLSYKLAEEHLNNNGVAMFYGFASDNAAGGHPRIIQALGQVNQGYCKPYGEDEYSTIGLQAFDVLFGQKVDTFFSLCGTGANVLALRKMVLPWHGIVCSSCAHINCEESGAPEWCVGAKLLPVPDVNGKITPKGINTYMADRQNFHRSKPTVLSLTQTTEKGSVYTIDEVRILVDYAHKNNMLVHMDGSRIANAVAALESAGAGSGHEVIRALTCEAGVDVLSFGGAKNGLLLAEAVVFFKRDLAEEFTIMRKQSLQLVSKMRFVAAQFIEFFKDDLWLKNARHANTMASKLADGLAKVPGISVPNAPEANAVFVKMQPEHMARLQSTYYFHEVDPVQHIARLMCCFATTQEEIDGLLKAAKACA